MDTHDHQSLAEQKPGSTPYDSYIVGAKDSDGRVIKTVIGRHREFVVYVTDQGAVGWNYNQLPPRLRQAVVEFQRLNGIASSQLRVEQRPQVAALLGPALYAALLSSEDEDITHCFDQAQAFITSKCTQNSRLAYVLLSLLFSGVIAAFTLWLSEHLGAGNDFWTAVSAGVLGGTSGSVVSIIQRARNLKVDPLDSAILLGLHGLSRVALGVIFGVLLVAASKANIALGHFSSDPWALFAIAAGAGFTERWVPELIGARAGSE